MCRLQAGIDLMSAVFELNHRKLADDPRYATLYDRTERLEELYTLVAEHLAGGTTAEWFARFTEAGMERIYLQVLDLHDLDHLRLIAAEVAPAVS